MTEQAVLILPRVKAPGRDEAFLSTARWQALPARRLLRVDDGEAAALPTELRAAWSTRGIHVHFLCQDPIPLSRDFARDAPVEEDEAVGVFLDPQGERCEYMAILVTPYGRVADARIENPLHHGLLNEVDRTWHCSGVRVRARGGKGQWQVELLIPFTGITPAIDIPVAGNRWTGNFYRIKRQPLVEISAWQPSLHTPPDLHDSEHFGIVEFGK